MQPKVESASTERSLYNPEFLEFRMTTKGQDTPSQSTRRKPPDLQTQHWCRRVRPQRLCASFYFDRALYCDAAVLDALLDNDGWRIDSSRPFEVVAYCCEGTNGGRFVTLPTYMFFLSKAEACGA